MVYIVQGMPIGEGFSPLPPRRWRDRLDMIPKYRGGVLPGEISPFTNDRSDDLIFPLFKNGPYIEPKMSLITNRRSDFPKFSN